MKKHKGIARAVLAAVAAGAILLSAVLPSLAAAPTDPAPDAPVATESGAPGQSAAPTEGADPIAPAPTGSTGPDGSAAPTETTAPIAPGPSTNPDAPWWEGIVPGLPDIPGMPDWDDIEWDLIKNIDGKIYVVSDLFGEKATVQDLVDAMEALSAFEGVYVEDAQGQRAAGTAPLGTGMTVVVPNPNGGDPVRIGIVVIGDANGDGQTTIADLVAAARALREEVSEVMQAALDVNKDGQVTLSDLVELVRRLQQGLL